MDMIIIRLFHIISLILKVQIIPLFIFRTILFALYFSFLH